MTTKPLTKDDVKKVAIDLMTKNGKTTTLDVKTILRAELFYADQKTVSAMMTELVDEEGWETQSDNGHKSFALPTPPAPQSIPSPDPQQASTPSKSPSTNSASLKNTSNDAWWNNDGGN